MVDLATKFTHSRARQWVIAVPNQTGELMIAGLPDGDRAFGVRSILQEGIVDTRSDRPSVMGDAARGWDGQVVVGPVVGVGDQVPDGHVVAAGLQTRTHLQRHVLELVEGQVAARAPVSRPVGVQRIAAQTDLHRHAVGRTRSPAAVVAAEDEVGVHIQFILLARAIARATLIGNRPTILATGDVPAEFDERTFGRRR